MIYADVTSSLIFPMKSWIGHFFIVCRKKWKGRYRQEWVVSVPFGNGNKLRKGYVTGLSGEADFQGGKIKEIQALLSDEETTESRLIALAAWMR